MIAPHVFRYCPLLLLAQSASGLHSPSIPPALSAALENQTSAALENRTSALENSTSALKGADLKGQPARLAAETGGASNVSLLASAKDIARRLSQGDYKLNPTLQLILWGCLAGIVVMVFVLVIVLVWVSGGPASKSGESLKGLSKSRGDSTNRSDRSLGKSSQTSERSIISEDCGMLDSATTSVIQEQLPGLPLCPLLVVPDSTRLGCVVQSDVCRMKQELSFDISTVPSRGGVPLFRARVSELSNDPAIYVETLGGRDQLAYLSTESLWRGANPTALGISRPWGLPFGTMQKCEDGGYVVTREEARLLKFEGDFLTHSIHVNLASGHTIATTVQTSPEEYQVNMHARTDAGLVILGLLAIDKCEVAARSISTGSSGNGVSSCGAGTEKV